MFYHGVKGGYSIQNNSPSIFKVEESSLGYMPPNSTFSPIASVLSLALDNNYPENLLGNSLTPNPDIDPIVPNENSEALYHHQSDFYQESIEKWHHKPVKTWESIDIIQWINNEARVLGKCCTEFPGDEFRDVDGAKLCQFTVHDFNRYDRQYGEHLYTQLQAIIRKDNSRQPNYAQLVPPPKSKYDHLESEEHGDINKFKEPHLISLQSKKESNNTPPQQLPAPTPSYHCDLNPTNSSSLKDNDSKNSEPEPASPKPIIKKRPGRPKGPSKRKKKPEKLGRLWEFLRDLLKNKEYCPSLIVWDNYEEGMFRFVHSDKVAKLWGTKKDNPDMNYEKLSRAMRYYYKSKVLQPVYGRRLVYKFGPTATGWKVENPNFRD